MARTKITTDITNNKVVIDGDTLYEFNQRARAVLGEIEANQQTLGEIVKEASDATGVSKAKLKKYFKSRFTGKVKEVQQDGVLFELLTNALDGEQTAPDEDE